MCPIWRSQVTSISLIAIDADIAMGGKKITGLGAGIAQNHSVRKGQAEILLADLETNVLSAAEAAVLISNHAGVATAHQDAPTLISNHAGVATAHQDAPTLISNHAGLVAAHHTAYTDAEAAAIALIMGG